MEVRPGQGKEKQKISRRHFKRRQEVKLRDLVTKTETETEKVRVAWLGASRAEKPHGHPGYPSLVLESLPPLLLWGWGGGPRLAHLHRQVALEVPDLVSAGRVMTSDFLSLALLPSYLETLSRGG